MSIKVEVTDPDTDRLYTVRIRPIALLWKIDRLSVIVEVWKLSTGERLEVWHLQILHETGEIVHRHRKYP